jgi:hypothetical protein
MLAYVLQVGAPARVAGVLVASYRFPATPPPVLRAYVQRPPEKQWGGPTYEMAQLMIITLLISEMNVWFYIYTWKDSACD